MQFDTIEVGYGYWTVSRHPKWWPLMPGPLHEDREYFGLSALHRHIHPAYLTDREYRAAEGNLDWPNDVWIAPLTCWADPRTGREIGRLDTDASGALLTPRQGEIDDRLGIVRTLCIRKARRMKRRPMPPHPLAGPNGYRIPVNFRALVAAYSPNGEPAAAPGGICPHRGADLNELKPGAEGTVVCPQHGLRCRLPAAATAAQSSHR